MMSDVRALLINGRVFTAADVGPPFTGGVAIEADRIVAVGSDEAVIRAASPDAHRVDVGGRTISAGVRRCPPPPRVHRRGAGRGGRALPGRCLDRNARRTNCGGRRGHSGRRLDPCRRPEPRGVRRRATPDALGPRRGDPRPSGPRPAHERPPRAREQPRARAPARLRRLVVRRAAVWSATIAAG